MTEKWASFVQTQTQEQKLDENLRTLKKHALLMSNDSGDVSSMCVPTPVAEVSMGPSVFLPEYATIVRVVLTAYIKGQSACILLLFM